MTRSVIRRLWKPVIAAAAGVCAFAGMTAPAPASTPFGKAVAAPAGYLNLHQCVYSGGSENFTNVMPNIGSSAFNSGSRVSSTADTSLSCGPGAGSYALNTGLSAVRALDLTGGRYLNLHQCVYSGGSENFTNVMPNIGSSAFNSGSRVSSTADTSLSCGPGAGSYALNTGLSAVRALDLTGG